MTSDDLFLQAANGNSDAYQFLVDVTEVAHFWDDLIDRDTKIVDVDIHKCMEQAVLGLPSNPFYRANFAGLSALIATAIQNWKTANEFEASGGDYEKRIAYITRSSYVDIVIHVARICGGSTHAARVSREARLIAHAEGYTGYLSALGEAK